MDRNTIKNLGAILGFVLSVLLVTPVLALTYSQDIGVNFTFNSSITLDLTSSDIVISSLAPGTVADSNVVTIGVISNGANGYTLNATVGNNTTYNTRDLIHSDTTQTAKFSSVDYSATPTIAANSSLDPNTWAYSYSTDNGTTWANYNGLPLWSDNEHVATLKDSNAPVANTTGDAIKFKIAAKADALQASGTYNNVINFTLVAKPVPTTLAMAYADAGAEQLNGFYKMQDMTTAICSAVEVEGDELRVIDVRDNTIYWIAKLADGNCWMTQNLDLYLDSNTTYTHADTDLGWGSDVVTQSWTPVRSTDTPLADGSFPNWRDSQVYPYSADVGGIYYAGYNNGNTLPQATVNYLTSANYTVTDGIKYINNDNGVNYFATAPFAYNGDHGHIGNYYNWSAAVASNDTSAFNASTIEDVSNNAQNSICPAGWRLPIVTGVSGTDEFIGLNDYYNNGVTNTDAGWAAAPFYSVRAGNVAVPESQIAQLYSSGANFYYWSSTVYSSPLAYGVTYNVNSSMNTNAAMQRLNGFSIRCVAR